MHSTYTDAQNGRAAVESKLPTFMRASGFEDSQPSPAVDNDEMVSFTGIRSSMEVVRRLVQ